MAVPSLAEVRAEIARRHVQEVRRNAVAARVGMEAFTRFTYPDYKFGWFNELVCRKLDKFLDDVAAQLAPRLILTAPPRHGKTELVSRRFPAFALGKHPDFSIIATAYGAELAGSNSRDVKRVIDSDAYAAIFPGTKLSRSSGDWVNKSDHWEVVERLGSYRGAGVNGPITGMGGNILIVDDPIKDGQEGESVAVRTSIWDWYQSTLYTRKTPGAGILVIMTRWNQDDLVGRLLDPPNGEGDNWEVVSFPAIAENNEEHRRAGEALHPERYSLKELRAIEAVVGQYRWASLYQQRPSPREGGLFVPEKMHIVEAMPMTGYVWVRGWDFAGTKDGDWTCGALIGRNKETGRFIIGDMVRFRGRPDEVQTKLKFTSDADKPLHVKQSLPKDPGQAGDHQVMTFTNLLAGASVESSPESGSKYIRAEPFAAQVNIGNVDVVRGPWLTALVDEMRNFPNGKYDDQIDGLSRAFMTLTESKGPMKISTAAIATMSRPMQRMGFGFR